MTDVTQRTRPLQPLLHDLLSTVAAPGLLLTGRDGQVRPGGVQGWFVGDRRLVSRLELSVDGSALDVVRADGPGDVSYVARSVGDPIADPTVRLDVTRVLESVPRAGCGQELVQDVVVESTAQEPVELTVRLAVDGDLAPMAAVKQGLAGGLSAGGDAGSVLDLATEPAAERDGDGLCWSLRLQRGEHARLRVRVRADAAPGLFGPGRPAPWAARVEATDPGLRRTAAQGLADLEGLLLAEGDDRFLAAGSPWFLTLFGRDSLWAARMLVPFDTGLALSTLRVLARRQGTRTDPATEEQPGKILHEVRPAELDLGEQVLPPVYYGTVDATALWVLALADACAWGGDREQVRALLPALRGCLAWLVEQSEASGWIRYVDQLEGRGLANQGWKDSHDSVQFADGRLAEAPVALSEVQAYAHEAAVRGGALLAAYDAEPVPGLRAWADDLAARFRREFWVDTAEGGHVAIALDGHGERVDSVASNLGHVLATGVLDEAQEARVAQVLADRRMDSGFGLRTLTIDSPRFSRLSYHGGSVWPHDTAIAVRGLAATGHRDQAARLTAGLLRAAEGFEHRLPELYGGDDADDVAHPAAYPAACRPQAWSAAAPLAALIAVAGLEADAETQVLRHPARTSALLGAWSIRGLRVGPHPFDVHVDADGTVRVDGVAEHTGWRVVAE